MGDVHLGTTSNNGDLLAKCVECGHGAEGSQLACVPQIAKTRSQAPMLLPCFFVGHSSRVVVPAFAAASDEATGSNVFVRRLDMHVPPKQHFRMYIK